MTMGLSNEIWLDILGYQGAYQISNQGRVKSMARSVKHRRGERIVKETILKHGVNECGYAFVMLSCENKLRSRRINRLVAIHFKPNPLGLPEVNHLDGNKLNNNDWNLEWSSISSNRKHAYRLGLNTGRKGTGKVSDKVVQEIVASTLSVQELSIIHNLSRRLVLGIKKRKIYKHINVNKDNIS